MRIIDPQGPELMAFFARAVGMTLPDAEPAPESIAAPVADLKPSPVLTDSEAEEIARLEARLERLRVVRRELDTLTRELNLVSAVARAAERGRQ